MHIYSQEGVFGEINHYSDDGYLGCSREGLFGEMNHYDAQGQYVGCSRENIFGGIDHYSTEGYEGYSVPGIIAGETHHFKDADGVSMPGIIDGYHTWIDE